MINCFVVSCCKHSAVYSKFNDRKTCHCYILEALIYTMQFLQFSALLWCHNGRDGVSNHQPHDCLLNHSFRRRSKETSTTSRLRVTGLCAGNPPVTGEFPVQMASNAENVSIWWRHHEIGCDVLIMHCNGAMQQLLFVWLSWQFDSCAQGLLCNRLVFLWFGIARFIPIFSGLLHLSHLPLDKMAAVSQTIFWDAFSWMKSFALWLKFHWSLFLTV